ncbi:MAG: DUF4139 domain-containing protein [Alphaproteobacteria bacterium]|nr:DUF4139 domain-containing protein [Alphaproteobacteria bacterium]
MRYSFISLLLAGSMIAGTVQAEPLLLPSKGNSLSLSIYNQNLALVKDIRTAAVKSGENEIIFDGVAQQIEAETAIIYGEGIRVKEQNYSYNLMSYNNLIEQYIGKEVSALRVNPKNGENIIENATLIGSANGQPILRFKYGIDSQFSGRIIFPQIPAGMSNKPTLAAKITSEQSGNKNLHLAYLTEGLSWKTDYVANVRNRDKLDLTGWVTITNNSGIDYEQAKIQLIAGKVNAARPVMARGMMMKAAAFSMDLQSNGVDEITPESINSYELYTLPNITTINDKQTKQLALIERNGVSYVKEFNLQAPFYFGNYASREFEKHHPNITYVIENTAAANLGISLPTGIMRFYENDSNGNLQFIGSAHINNTAKEDTLRLNLGEAFNISVSGKIKQVKSNDIKHEKISKCLVTKVVKTYDVEITVNNAENENNVVVISQDFPQDYKITSESVKSELKNATTRKWKVKVAPNSKQTLTYSVDITESSKTCD